MKPPKVIRVYKNLKSGGGVQTRLAELLPQLNRYADLRVLCYRNKGDRAGEMESIGIPVDFIRLGSKWSPLTQRKFVQYFKRFTPDIVHTHEYTANTFAQVAAYRAGVPVRIRHIHSMAVYGWKGRLGTRMRVLADIYAAKRSTVTLAVSEAVRRQFLSMTGLPERYCRVLYNGVDLSRFNGCSERGKIFRSEFGIDSDAPVIGIVGRLSKGKGHEYFLKAAKIVSLKLPDARFIIVGDGGLESVLKRQASSLGLDDSVIFTGRRNDVGSALGAMDLFVFTGSPEEGDRVQDGLPGVVIEAQAAGLPVISFDLPMMKELLASGVNGELVDVGDAESLAVKIVQYLESPEKRSAAAEAAQKNSKRFSLDVCVAKTIALYEELITK